MITIFLHVPRTAGTTLQAIAREQYQDDEILRIYGKDIVNPWEAVAKDARARGFRRLKWITGHISADILWWGWNGKAGQAVTFLRDPIERTLSVYHYIRRSPGHHLHKYARGMSLIDFMESGVTTELDNGMTRQISGICGELPQTPYNEGGALSTEPLSGESAKTALFAARTNLSDFAVVGITERFRESLLQFRDVLGWDIGDEMMHLNRLTGRPHKSDLKEDSPTLAVIKRYNRLDQELYEYGLELFEERGG